MPVTVKFMLETKIMNVISVRQWLTQGSWSLPMNDATDEDMAAFLNASNKSYGFLRQEALIADFKRYVAGRPMHLGNDWARMSRAAVRSQNFKRSLSDPRVDYTGVPAYDDNYLHPSDLNLLNQQSSDFILEHLSMGELFDLYDVLVIGETHRELSASKYLHICHAMLSGEKKYEVRILLDGLARKQNDEPLGVGQVAANFPMLTNLVNSPVYLPKVPWKLYEHYKFYGLEPPETEQFSLCEKIDKLSLQKQWQAAAWFYFNLREDEEFSITAKQLKGIVDYNELMDDANEFTSSGQKKLSPAMAGRIKHAADKIEFFNKSTIRMDANLDWGRTISEVLEAPTANSKSKIPVRVLVICGENHTLSRSVGAVPVQAAVKEGVRVQTLVFTTDHQVLEYRQLGGSINYVYTVPDSFLKLKSYGLL